ncbi:hypothetical protein JG688_00018047, partial [Phytophthora aleatoria]
GDFQKERQFRALNAVNENELVRVVRYGVSDEEPQQEEEGSRVRKWSLVVGDIVQLEPGDVVPADGLAFNTRELNVDESTLTGESELMRNGDALLMQGSESSGEEVLPVKLYSGTRVMEGFAKMLVLCVGEHSQYGQITALINGSAQGEEQIDDDEKKSKQSKKIQALNLGKMGVVVASLIFIVLCARFSIKTFVQEPRKSWDASYLRDYLSYFILGTTILVVAIPEGLPLAVAIALALAVRRMLRGRSLVRHLAACETAGNATMLCVDKTGTLTANQMSVARLWLAPDNEKDFVSLLEDAPGAVQVDFNSADKAKAAMNDAMIRTLCEGVALNSTAELLPPGEGDTADTSLRVLPRSSPQDKHTLTARTTHRHFEQLTWILRWESSIVLMDDDLAGVVSAVVSGRGVFDGISQFLQFQITVIAVALSEACVGAVTLRQSHIAAVQILWVILFMDVFASLVLMTDDSSDKF